MLVGPAGAGKTTLAMQYVLAAATQGRRVSVFMFDELQGLMVDRLKVIGLDLQPALAAGTMGSASVSVSW